MDDLKGNENRARIDCRRRTRPACAVPADGGQSELPDPEAEKPHLNPAAVVATDGAIGLFRISPRMLGGIGRPMVPATSVGPRSALAGVILF
jgi:hypothetical protein